MAIFFWLWRLSSFIRHVIDSYRIKRFFEEKLDIKETDIETSNKQSFDLTRTQSVVSHQKKLNSSMGRSHQQNGSTFKWNSQHIVHCQQNHEVIPNKQINEKFFATFCIKPSCSIIHPLHFFCSTRF